MYKKDDRLPHQKSTFFIASKRVGLSLDIWPSWKALKCLLQNICLLLDWLYRKRNPLITTVVDSSIFKKNNTYNLREKGLRKILFLPRYSNDEIIINTEKYFCTDGFFFRRTILFLPRYSNDEIIINTKKYFCTDGFFVNHFASKMILLIFCKILQFIYLNILFQTLW